MSNVARTIRTIAHLQPRQVIGRLIRRFPAQLDISSPSVTSRRPTVRWQPCTGRPATLVEANRILVHSQEGGIEDPAIWNDRTRDKLWLYHLHYFDDLLADHAEARAAWHIPLIERWIVENPAATGVGWEPYTVSRRIVNWIGWSLAGGELSERAQSSLALQAKVLSQRLEYHLLGNHLFSDARALVFAGCFFSGKEADQWLHTGLSILDQECREQILGDGGHFELSPMYHAVMLEDIVDLVQLASLYPERRAVAERAERWRKLAGAMLGWLEVMRHADGEIAFFNDATFGQARAPTNVSNYARRFGIVSAGPAEATVHLRESGYVKLARGPFLVFLDAAAVGPAYLPGHAHADTLSLEISVGLERLVTNSGTSTYTEGSARAAERSTAAHATVEIDGENSSEVWGAFRVGRRARVFDVCVGNAGSRGFAEAWHDGYRFLSGRPQHRRRIEVEPSRVIIRDTMSNCAAHTALGRLPLHPGTQVWRRDDRRWGVRMSSGRELTVEVRGATEVFLDTGSYATSFGHREPRPVLTWSAGFAPILSVETEIVL